MIKAENRVIKIYDYSDFPLNGMEYDDYCYSFAETYGEDSKVFKAVDEVFLSLEHDGGKWVDVFNKLRLRLCERGFEKEVLKQDKLFEEKVKKILNSVDSGKRNLDSRLAYTPMRERWKKEQMVFKASKRNP